jgi:hypothetical protein
MAAEAPVPLGTTSTFAVLAGSTVTNTGATVVDGDAGGDVAVSPGSAITGFPPGTLTGMTHANDGVAIQAQADLVTAYDNAANRPTTQDLTGQDLGGLTLMPGVYSFSSEAQLTETLTLDAQGDPDAVFIFKIGTALTTASDSTVSLVNGARYCRTFWQVGSSATLGTGSHFVGHLFAMASVTANTGATVQGQLLARSGAVTLDTNNITNGVCAALGGALEISAPTDTADLGTLVNTLGGGTVRGQLGIVKVTDARSAAPGSGWVASAVSSAFTPPVGEAIPATVVSYNAGTITKVGTATYTANNPVGLEGVSPVVTATGITGDNSATWDPTISVAVPGGMAAGVYTATITHSVL